MRFWTVALVLGAFIACKKKEESTPPAPVEDLVVLEGELTSERVLDANKKYLIKGQYIVREGGVLRIPAGTVIFGDRSTKGTLIIDRGGKIYAEGTPEKPIIFTSKFAPGERDRGDWGGVIILGRAPVNSANVTIEGINPPIEYGGTDPEDDSGIFRYVRIEYAGVALTPNNEINGLTLGGVGRRTQIDHVQVSFSGDDGLEWFGGTVDAKYLVSYGTWDDDFDGDFGWSGRVQFALAIRDPFGADQSGSNGFEMDNDPSGSNSQPYTAPVLSNVTIVGPIARKGGSRSSNYQNTLHLRRNAAVSLSNSIVGGFPTGLRIDGGSGSTADHYSAGRAILWHNVLLVDSGNASAAFRGGQGNTDSATKAIWQDSGAGNLTLVDSNLAVLGGYSTATPAPFWSFIQGQANPSLRLPASSPWATGADFSHPKLSDSFFEQVSFKGALAPDRDWTDGWTHFDPQNAQY
jgi:hypothetical protein